jgi:hypothetical protein
VPSADPNEVAAVREFAYPTQTAFTAAPDGRLIMPYTTELDVT